MGFEFVSTAVLVVAIAASTFVMADARGRDPMGWVLLTMILGPIPLAVLPFMRSADENREPRPYGLKVAVILGCGAALAIALLAWEFSAA